MKRTQIFLLLAVLAVAASGADLRIIAVAEPATTLPGIPVALRLTIQNASGLTQELPRSYVLRVVPPAGEPFLATGQGGPHPVNDLPPEYQTDLTLAPGETREIYLPLGVSAGEPGFFVDPRLVAPGLYQLQLIFSADFDGKRLAAGWDHTVRTGLSGWPRTTESAVTIAKPAGPDATVWNEIISRTGGGTLGSVGPDRRIQIAREILKTAPESSYTPHLIMLLPPRSDEELFSLGDEILARSPPPTVIYRVLMTRADVRLLRAQEAASQGDLQRALLLRAEAERLLQTLQKEAKTDLARRQARFRLAELPSERDLVQQANAVE